MRFEVVTVFIGFTSIENRSLEFEPAIREASRQYTETYVRRVLQVMR